MYIKSKSACSIIIYDFELKQKSEIILSEIGEIQPGVNKNYESKTLLFSFTSPMTFWEFYELNLETKELKLTGYKKLMGP